MYQYIDYPTIEIDQRRHYDLGGTRRYPSITTLLGATGDKTYLKEWRDRVGATEANRISHEAALRGTNVHTLIDRYLKKQPIHAEEFSPNHLLLFKSLIRELKKINRVYGQEVVLYSDILRIAGRCDLIAEYNGVMAIIDYKTSSRIKDESQIKDYFLQAAFYAIAHNSMFNTSIQQIIILMAIENHLPRTFKKQLDDQLLLTLAERTCKYYDFNEKREQP